jgi:type VI secretion system secreted protein VgrG
MAPINLRASIETSLGQDVLRLHRFAVTARLSEVFEMVVDVTSKDPQDFLPLLYKPVTVKITGGKGFDRVYSGLLFGAELVGEEWSQSLSDPWKSCHYRLTVKPWLAALAETTDIRIFQKQTVTDIIQSVFRSAGYSNFDFTGAAESYPVREYCVQFRESDLSFVSRLMEEEGLYYFFTHNAAGHTLKVCDGPGAHKAPDDLPKVEFMPSQQAGFDRPYIYRWKERLLTGSSAADVSEHHFLVPKASNEGAKESSGVGLRTNSKLYDHPSGIGALDEDAVIKNGGLPNQAERQAQLRLQAGRADSRTFVGETTAFAISAGDKITLDRHPLKELNAPFMVTMASHTLDFGLPGADDAPPGGSRAVVIVEAIPADNNWRPQRRTPKPLVGGPQTAVVVGPLKQPSATDDTIYVDEHGRVKVQFFWDRLGKLDTKSSCWVRVSQGWADGGFGAVMLPRIGQEVLVDFLDGDPDRPIITGRVYNADRMPPYKLPDRKTVSTIKSRTVGPSKPYEEAEEPPQSSDIGFNELRFEDKGGDEEVFLHAQRDMKAWVRLDETRKVGRDQGLRVGRNRDTHVKQNESLTVEQGDETREVTKGSRTTKIHKDDNLDVATGSLVTKVDQGDHKTTVGQGNLSVNVSSGKATIEAAQSIELKVGATTVKLTPTGIEMSGMTIKIDAKMALSASGGMTTEVKAGMMLTINGAMVMIN